jgi:acetoin utilization deacetylase AcuC-like enzyme
MPMLPFKLVYHDRYDLNFGDHVFPSRKYRLIRERMLAERFASAADFVMPEAAREEDLLLVHDPGWITRLRTGTLEYREILRLEVPYSRQMVDAFFLSAGGSILAARDALRHGVGYNIGGGFHHAFPGHGEGFCAIHDIAVAVRRLLSDGEIAKAMVVDTDVHQGNGTAFIFRDDPAVATLSIHQFNNYPAEKPPSSLDIHLPDGVGDSEYLEALREGYLPLLESFRPEFIFYVAGADPYCQDQLGGLSLTLDGLLERDRIIIGAALEAGVPVAIALAGGYAIRVADTVTIHTNTAKAALAALQRTGWRGRKTAAAPPQV